MAVIRDGYEPPEQVARRDGVTAVPVGVGSPEAPLAVVVVTYASAAVVADCLRAVRQAIEPGLPYRMIVVDNASPDNTCAVVARADAGAELVRRPVNDGFAAGVNAGLGVAAECDVLVLNADVRLSPGSVSVLRRSLRRAGVGVAVPKLLTEAGALHPSLRRPPTVLRAFGEALLGGGRAGRIAALGETLTAPADYAEPRDVAWATGAAWLVRRACLAGTGPLDERYFLYSEETEFMLRAGDRGWSVRYEPSAVAVHLGGDQHTSPRLGSIAVTNRVRLHRERYGRVAASGLWLGAVLNEVIRVLTGRPHRAVHTAALRELCRMRRWPVLPGTAPPADVTRVPLGPIGLDPLTEQQLVDHVRSTWHEGFGGSVVTANVDILRAVSRAPELADLVNKASCVVADGMPLVWATRMSGRPVPTRVTGSSLVYSLARAAGAEGRRVYLLGGDPGVPEAASLTLTEQIPGLVIAGCCSPPFGFERSDAAVREVVALVSATKPDLVLVGLGFPKQEHMIARLREELPD
ncbi:MAG TPA: WecB/TagA/CpsF family glycosyltransferase, partial [Pseudonocardia sp.]|nr:WecB/TagA/CpsF family glycosyltransferase [Pseudonocardia sp.]